MYVVEIESREGYNNSCMFFVCVIVTKNYILFHLLAVNVITKFILTALVKGFFFFFFYSAAIGSVRFDNPYSNCEIQVLTAVSSLHSEENSPHPKNQLFHTPSSVLCRTEPCPPDSRGIDLFPQERNQGLWPRKRAEDDKKRN